LPEDELAIVQSWHHMVDGEFVLLHQMKEYAEFLMTEGETRIYGVLGLSKTFSEMVDAPMPLVVNTTLFPFRGKIISACGHPPGISRTPRTRVSQRFDTLHSGGSYIVFCLSVTWSFGHPPASGTHGSRSEPEPCAQRQQ
jgi:hypothetical protein